MIYLDTEVQGYKHTFGRNAIKTHVPLGFIACL